MICAEIDALWAAAVVERPWLFDGQILTVTAWIGDRLRLARASYRHVIAARRSPDLAAVLRLRPLAVSGILTCPQGLVLGRRGQKVMQGAGLWELVPSGGVEPPEEGAVPDLETQILKELWEEIGLRPAQVSVGAPLALLEDTDNGVIDIVLPLATDLPAEAILAAHRAGACPEYAELAVTAAADADAGNRALLPETRTILTLLASPTWPHPLGQPTAEPTAPNQPSQTNQP